MTLWCGASGDRGCFTYRVRTKGEREGREGGKGEVRVGEGVTGDVFWLAGGSGRLREVNLDFKEGRCGRGLYRLWTKNSREGVGKDQLQSMGGEAMGDGRACDKWVRKGGGCVDKGRYTEKEVDGDETVLRSGFMM